MYSSEHRKLKCGNIEIEDLIPIRCCTFWKYSIDMWQFMRRNSYLFEAFWSNWCIIMWHHYFIPHSHVTSERFSLYTCCTYLCCRPMPSKSCIVSMKNYDKFNAVGVVCYLQQCKPSRYQYGIRTSSPTISHRQCLCLHSDIMRPVFNRHFK